MSSIATGARREKRTAPPAKAETAVRELLTYAGIEINGPRSWDMLVHDRRIYARVLAEGSIGLGEAYMDGWWDCDQLDEFFHRVVRADLGGKIGISPYWVWLVLTSRLKNRQSKQRAVRVADVHYNLDLDIFEATFDQRVTGSCAYWANAANLDAAQDAKLDLICRKIGLKPGQSVLDIGCGWGAFMGYAAERYGARCVGVTIAREQADYVERRYRGQPIEAQLKDYRDFVGQVDHVVSMGMFEHVGPKNYGAYFDVARRALKPGGMFLLHSIWASEKSLAIDPWLDKYIFPNGVLPTVGQVAEAVEGRFVIENVENFGADYDRTLMAWRANFMSRRQEMAQKHGERFCRLWDYYLCCCAGGFRSRRINVGQFVLSPHGAPGGWRLPPVQKAPAPAPASAPAPAHERATQTVG